MAAACVSWGLAGCVNQHPERATQGAGDKIVATSTALLDICDKLELDLAGIPRTSRDIPSRYQGVREVGTPMAPDVEVLASMRPSCIISPNTLIEDLRTKYAAIGAPCIFVNLRSVEGMYDSIDYLGRKFDRMTQAAGLRRAFESYLQDFNVGLAGKTPPRVLVLMGVPGSYLVATANSYAGSLVRLAGGRNVYDDTTEEFLEANTEDMQARDPDIIMRTAHALPDSVMAMFAEEFQTNDIWKHFRAVQDGAVYDLPYEMFGRSATFDYPAALEYLKGLLYPSEAA